MSVPETHSDWLCLSYVPKSLPITVLQARGPF
jgi:hypothetical protein